MKIASKDKSYPVDERGNRPDTCLIYLREVTASGKAPIVHVYRGTRTLLPVQADLPKFKGYNSMWKADVEKLACERMLTAEAVLRSEEEEVQGRKERQ